MTIINNINDLQSLKTAVGAAYFHLLLSNEIPQHGLCLAGINAWCKFQKTEAESNERNYNRTRRRGRPFTRWLNDVEKDLKLMGINQWKTIVTDKVNWRRITESDLISKGLSSSRRRRIS
ncbi:hypothetical protein TNCV_1830101 [Trichonephila clavipes]|nr:hypothetical protein TNCV_1830101 [Trichonephila clavipes]